MASSFEDKVALARAKLLASPPAPSVPAGEQVLLSFRVPAQLREQAHEAAAAQGAASLQAWLTQILRDAIEEALGAGSGLAAQLQRHLIGTLTASVRDGTYARFVAEHDDPELRG